MFRRVARHRAKGAAHLCSDGWKGDGREVCEAGDMEKARKWVLMYEHAAAVGAASEGAAARIYLFLFRDFTFCYLLLGHPAARLVVSGLFHYRKDTKVDGAAASHCYNR